MRVGVLSQSLSMCLHSDSVCFLTLLKLEGGVRVALQGHD